ncbi:hypothetical protein EDD80_11642 [Anseongella ginsenosidimutans]|uniref:Leucine rich repeat (LRR) protein n=1 Tax=Anseongella ginsenosidimutans TaxID=496056 RepID=A0A4R3KME1_9SPHI|nr:hypothetical protein [Anseongella ginsenosidimutans]QEC53806.1 hypothetical protein FRZ59_16665 [Anseongella ginsenosidimutans]TCS84950.1 hypothetical protein EDD80_11642 [Anseongella ginsenosidimutans]
MRHHSQGHHAGASQTKSGNLIFLPFFHLLAIINESKMKTGPMLFLSLLLVFNACRGQENPENGCEPDISVDEISAELTLRDIDFEEPALLDAIIENNRSYIYTDTLATPIKYVEEIILSNTELKSTKDLHYFINLKKLILHDVNISCINLSNNINLEQLQLPDNHLRTIDLSNNTKLTGLNLGGNALETIDLTKNPLIEQLLLNNNLLQAIELGNLENLKGINVSFNQLTELDLKNNPGVTHINAQKNAISAISTAHLYKLHELTLADNKLTEIDLSANESLSDVVLFNNQISAVKLPNTYIDRILLANNKIVDIVLPKDMGFDTFWLYDNPLSKKTLKYLEKIGGISIGNE